MTTTTTRTVFTVETLIQERERIVARLAERPAADYREAWALRDRLDNIRRLLTPVTATDMARRQCDEQVADGKSYWTGETLYRPCGSPARNRFYGWLNGPREEYLCKRHARAYLDPICMPGWIEGVVTLRYPKCRKGHEWQTVPTQRSLDWRDWFNFGDVLATEYRGCKQCGEPQVACEMEGCTVPAGHTTLHSWNNVDHGLDSTALID